MIHIVTTTKAVVKIILTKTTKIVFDRQNDILAREDLDSFVHQYQYQYQESFDQDQDKDKDQEEEEDNFVECKSHLDRRLLLFFARQVSGGFYINFASLYHSLIFTLCEL